MKTPTRRDLIESRSEMFALLVSTNERLDKATRMGDAATTRIMQSTAEGLCSRINRLTATIGDR